MYLVNFQIRSLNRHVEKCYPSFSDLFFKCLKFLNNFTARKMPISFVPWCEIERDTAVKNISRNKSKKLKSTSILANLAPLSIDL